MSSALDAFVRAAPRLQRTGLRALLALARRPRGALLLARLPAADQVAHATLSMARYDDDAVARTLGWDAAAVVARGRALRARAAGRERALAAGHPVSALSEGALAAGSAVAAPSERPLAAGHPVSAPTEGPARTRAERR